MRNRKKVLLFLCIFIVGLVGCTNKSTFPKNKSTYSKELVDWEQGFIVGSIQQGTQSYISNYQEITYDVPLDSQFVKGVILRNNVNEYLGVSVYQTDEALDYYLEQVPADGGSVEMSAVSHEWGIENGKFLCFDAIGEQLYFILGTYESNNTEETDFPDGLYVVCTDKEGNLLSKVDVMPGLRDLGYSGYIDYAYVDGDGNTYISAIDDNGYAGIFCVDTEGKSVSAYQCKVPYEDLVFGPVRDNMGRIFFPVYEKGESATKLIWKNSKNEWTTLAELEYQTISNWYAMRDNMIYYADGSSLVRWDVLSGERKKLLSLKDNGMEDSRNLILLLADEEVSLRYFSEDKEWVAKVTEKEPFSGPSIEVAVFTHLSGADFIKNALATFSREQSCAVSVAQPKEDADKSRLLMEVVNGKGPDILYLPYEEMVQLKNKGAILELSDMIPNATLEKMLPGAVEMGKVDDALYGIPASVQIITMFTNREIWDKDGWSLDDIMDLSDKHSDIDCYFTGDVENEHLGTNVIWLLGYDIDQQKSKFIDWESRTSCFEKNNFVEVLEFIDFWDKNQKSYRSEGLEYARDRIAIKDALGFGTESGEMIFFDMLMDEFGETCYAVGVPAEDRQGTYLTTEGVLVVNANIAEEKKESIQAILNYIVGDECQQKLYNSISILKGMADSRVGYEGESGCYYWKKNESTFILLHAQADGSSYLEEFNQLLEKAVPYKGISPLLEIVLEECVPFFMGDRSALDVTRKIDNRVQLYLDENY